MTLAPFPPDRLDDLSLRLLDLATVIRKMSVKARENELVKFELHGQKIDEWMTHLEDWAHDGLARLETSLIRAEAEKRAKDARKRGFKKT